MNKVWLARLLTAVAVLHGLAAGAAAEVHDIGSIGATFESGDWERTDLVASLGKDQFVLVGRDTFLVFLEVPALYDQRAVFVDALERFAGNAGLALENFELAPDTDFERYETLTRASRRFSGSTSGIDLAYQLDLLSAGDGMGYFLLAWTTGDKAEALSAVLDEAVEQFSLPGPDSVWAEKTRPSAHRYEFGEWTVSLEFRESVFGVGDSEPPQRYSLLADAGNLAVHLFVNEFSGELDEVLTRVVEVASEGDEYEELMRRELDSDIGPAREVLLRGQSEPVTDLAVAVIGLGGDRWIDLRMVSTGVVGHREELWTGLLSSLQAERAAQVDAYPIAEEDEPEPVEAFLTSAARELLEGAELLASAPWTSAPVMRPDGAVLGVANREVRLVPGASGSEPQVLYRSDSYNPGTPVSWGENVLLIAPGREVRRIRDGGVEPAGFRADRATLFGESLLVARSAERPTVLGFDHLPVVGPLELLVRDQDGQERLLVELPERRIQALAVRGDQALAAVKPRAGSDSAAEAAVELVLVDIRKAKAKAKEIGRWRQVDRLAATSGGWLVTGRAENGDLGVFEVQDDGSRQRLLSGGTQVGLAADGESLVFATQPCLGPRPESEMCLYRAALTAVRDYGAGFWPFGSNLLDAIAAQAPGSGLRAVTRREEVAAAVASADDAARRLSGVGLPLTVGGVDRLLFIAASDDRLSSQAVDLLSLLLAEVLVREGASWVEPVEALSSLGDRSGWEDDNLVAVALHAPGVVVNTVYDSEGWYHPIEEILDRADGRALFVSTDPAAVRAAARAVDLEDLPERVRSGSADELSRLLAERGPNLHLRRQVYRRLAAHQRFEALASVARGFTAEDEAEAFDLLALHAGELSRESGGTEVGPQIVGLRAGIESHPDEAGLYLLLGLAYERSSLPDKPKLAKACYEKVQELSRWGASAEAAQEALDRLAADR